MGKTIMRLLSDEDVKKTRGEALKILEDVGVVVSHAAGKKMLKEFGAKVDRQTDLVRIPTDLTQQCLNRLPQKIVMGGRSLDKDVVLEVGNGKVHNRSMSGAEGYVDLYDRKFRKALLSDVKDFAILVDALENIHIGTAPYYSDAGLNMNARDVRCLELLLENMNKPILIQPYGEKNLQYMIKLGIVERGSEEEFRMRPRFAVVASPVSPLAYPGNAVDILLLAGKYGIPVEIAPLPIAGAGGPVTLAGNVLLAIAEHLAAIVISQLANPGAPVIFAARPQILDMSTGAVLEGNVEAAMISAAETQVAKEGFGWLTDMYGPTSDSLLPDGQSIIERCFNTTLPAYAGADILTGGGNYETSYTIDPVQLAIDDEIYGMTARILRGIEVNDDTLGLDAVRRVGAGVERSYLTDPHTLKYFRTEYFKPKVLTHFLRTTWESKGGKDLNERVKERVMGILKEHKPTPLLEVVVREMRLITENAEAEITEVSTV